MNYFLSLFIFLFSFEVLAQELTISGTLVDEKNTPVAFANVLLLSENDSVIAGVSSNEKGFFEFTNIVPNTYKLKISFVGYKQFIKTIKLLKSKNLGTIIFETATSSLDEVVITARKPTLEREADRLIFNVENTALSEGSLLEILQSTPGVLILNNTITVKNIAPTVYINDRKVNLSASEITQLLESSSASTVKKIEVITNPSARYDAESGAVINIIMNKNLITGYRGSIFKNYTQGVFPRYNTGINQFYKTKKVNLNLNYSFTKNKINRKDRNTINYLDNNNGLNERWKIDNNRITRSETHNLNVVFDYLIDDNNTLSFTSNSLLLPFFDYKINSKNVVLDTENSKLLDFNANNNSKDNKYNLGFNLNFKHRLKNNAQLDFNFYYTDYDYNRNQNVSSDYFFINNTINFSTAFNTNSNQGTNIFNSQIDYTLPINAVSEFALGIKTAKINTNSSIIQYDINQTTGASVLNNLNSNAFIYDESIFAAYTTYSNTLGAFSFNGGLRVEHTSVDGLSVSDNKKNGQDYFEFFPTVSLSFKVSENTNFYTNYKRSILRPNYQLLNPFNFFLNDNTVVKGNPNLKPQFTNKVLLGISLYDFLVVETFYMADKDAIYEIPIQDNSNTIITFIPANINTSNQYGLDIEFYKNITGRWFLYLANRIANIEEALVVNNIKTSQNQWYNYSVISSDYNFLKDNSLSANLSLTHIGKNLVGLRRLDQRLVSNLAIKKTLFNKKATVSLVFSDLFNTQDYGVETQYKNQNNYFFSDEDDRYIKLGFNYKFGNTTLKTNNRVKATKEFNRLNN